MKYVLLIISIIIGQHLFAQDKNDFFGIASKYANEENYPKAIEFYNKELKRNPENYSALFNRALCESYAGENEKSIQSLTQVIEMKSDYHKAYLNRGLVKRDITDYEGALVDFNKSIEIKEDYLEAFYHRGIINEYLNHSEAACSDLNKAKELNEKKISELIKVACDSVRPSNYANILKLSKVSDDETYGFTSQNPIKVGNGLHSGPMNQRMYLNLLRDTKGQSITYNRNGSCCQYESENGFLGYGSVDVYNIEYLDKKGKKKTSTLYISFYDYEEPMIPVGFETIK